MMIQADEPTKRGEIEGKQDVTTFEEEGARQPAQDSTELDCFKRIASGVYCDF
jgi:hypothetical protein